MNKKSVEKGVLVAVVLVGGVVVYNQWGPIKQSASADSVAAGYQPMKVYNAEIHWDRLDRTESTAYQASGRNIFALRLPAPPKPAPAPPEPVVEAPPPPPPPPPPPKLPLKFIGYGTAPDGPYKHAFLSNGESEYIVREGDTVLGRFRILRITNSTLEFEEMATGRHGSMPLENQDVTK